MKEQILAVKRMQDYIENHLDEDLSFEKLSRISHYSPWYSRRLFLEYTGCSPAEYIRKIRLSKSALYLRDHDCKITDVALTMGFDSVDGYQRAFLKEFGCNPKEFSKHPVPVTLFTPFSVKARYGERKENMEKTRSIFLSVIQKPERKIIMKRGIHATDYFEYGNEVGCDVWGLLTSIKSISGEPVCMWLPNKYRKPNTSEYVQGVEVALDDPVEVPEGFDVITLPACEYLMFQGEPFEEEDYEIAISEIWEAEKKYQPEVLGYVWNTDEPRIQLEPIGTRGYIELLPIKKNGITNQ